MSFGKTSAGALQIKDNNDYYPFGMNHLKTGNAYFGSGSYVKYKYNNKELQETGMYDYGWRQYMADIAKWNGIDQLAEKYISASPYAYVLNNPINMFDPDGRLSESFINNLLNSSSGTKWTNNDNGTFSNNWGDTMNNNGVGLNFDISTGFYEGRGGEKLLTIDIPGINIIGKHNQWGQAFQNKFNSYMDFWNNRNNFGLFSKFVSYLANSIDDLGTTFIKTTNETFYSFSGGTNDPDKETLNKLRPHDKIEANNMFEYILGGYARSSKPVNVRPDQFQTAIDMMSLSSLPRGNGFYPPEGLVNPDTLGIWTTQATGILRMSDGTSYSLKYKNVRGEGLSKRTLDSLNKAVKDSNDYWNKQYYKR